MRAIIQWRKDIITDCYILISSETESVSLMTHNNDMNMCVCDPDCEGQSD